METLFFVALGAVICLAEKLKNSYDGYKYNKDGGFEAKHPCFKRDNNGKGIHN